MRFSAVIDNTALVYLTQLNRRWPLFHLLRNLIHTLHIPVEIKNEYAMGLAWEPDRAWLLNRLNTEQGFYRLCTAYDSFVAITIASVKGIDKGEAELYSQFKKLSLQLVISDDRRFATAVRTLDAGLQVYSTLHLICWLDVLRYLPTDWNTMITELHGLGPFTSKSLRAAYTEIAQKTGISMTKKVLSEKCSLKVILPK